MGNGHKLNRLNEIKKKKTTVSKKKNPKAKEDQGSFIAHLLTISK